MKLKLNTEELLKALNTVTRVIPKNPTMPVLGNLLFDFINESGTKYIALRGTNLQNTITTYLYTDFDDKSKSFLFIDPFKLKTFITKVKTIEFIEFELSEEDIEENGVKRKVGQAKIKAGKDKLIMPISFDVKDFPLYPDIKEESSMKMEYNTFKTLIEEAFIFTSNDELRPVMGSVHINQLSEDTFDFVASDAHIMYRNTVSGIETNNSDIKVNLIKDTKNLLPISKSEFIDIRIGKKFTELNIDNVIIHSLNVEGNYPAYNSVIPTDSPFDIIIPKNDLLDRLDKCSLADNESGLVQLSITTDGLGLKSKNMFGNEFNTTMDLNSVVTENNVMELGVKGTFLANLLKVISGDEITLNYKEPTRAMLITDPSDENKTLLIMPMMLK